MGKIKLEWKDGQVWRHVDLDVSNTANGNMKLKHDNKVYVFKNLAQGTPVVTPIDGSWKKVGRIALHGIVFIGEGQSYDEVLYSPAGMEASRKLLENLRTDKRERLEKPVEKFNFPTIV